MTIGEQLNYAAGKVDSYGFFNGGRETGAFHSDEVSDYGAGADVVFDNSPAAKQPEPEPTEPEPDELKELCFRLYGVASNKSAMHVAFTGAQRVAVGQLLSDWTADAIVAAFREFIREFKDFDMSHATKKFVEGAAEDILATLVERDRKAAQQAEEQRVKAKARAEKDRRDEIGREIMLDEELDSWEKWDAIASDDERWTDEDAVRDRAVARDGAAAGSHTDRAELWNLEQEAMASPGLQAELAARLAETDELRQQRRRQRQEKQRAHDEHRRERERERKRREWKQEQDRVLGELAEIAARREEAMARREQASATDAPQSPHGLFGVFAA